MRSVTLHVDDRPSLSGRGKSKPKAQPARKSPSRLKIRWPGALRSRSSRRAALAGSGMLVLLIAAALFPGKKVENQLVAWSGQAGYRVDDIFVEGRARTPRDQLLTALGVKRGDAILSVDLAAAQKRIEEIPWVRTATVERRLPNQIHILITERSPIALWQNKGRYFLVDHDGQIVGDQIDDYAGLPLTVGEGAPDHAAELLALLESEPALKDRVKAAPPTPRMSRRPDRSPRRNSPTERTRKGHVQAQAPPRTDRGPRCRHHESVLLHRARQ